MKNLKSKKFSYFERQLHTTLQSILSNVVQNYRSYLICDSTLGYFNGRPPLTLIDTYEKFIIAYFDQKSLINQQSDEMKIDFVSSIEDEIIFLKLRTSFVQKFNESMNLKSFVMLDSVRLLVDKMQH